MKLNLKKKIPAKKVLKTLLPLTLLCFALLIIVFSVKRKKSIDVKEKEILLTEPPSQSTTTQTSHIKPMFRYNPQYTGVSPYVGPTKKPKFEWNIDVGVYWSSPAISTDGTIYVGSYEDYGLYAIIPNGALKWKYEAGAPIWTSSPAISTDGTIYVGSFHYIGPYIDIGPYIGPFKNIGARDYYLHAVNPNGKLKWKYRTGGGIVSSPTIGQDGTIYIGAYDFYLHAVNPNGELKWKYKTKGGLTSSPAIGPDGTIYIVSSNYYIHAVSPNGELKWKHNIENILSSPAIGPDGTIYTGDIHAINPNGTLKWTYKVGYTSSSPAVAQNTVYTKSPTHLFAINSKDGTLKWKYKDKVPTSASPIIDAAGNIYFGNHYNHLFCFTPEGKLLWKIDDAKTGDIEREIALDQHGNIYVIGTEGFLSKWKNPDEQPIPSPSPSPLPSPSPSPSPLPKADLSITKQDNPDPVEIESLLTYTLTITNNGPDTAGQVQATDTLPAQEFYFNSASSSQGTCSHTSGIVTCSLGNMASGTQATITIDGYVYGLPQEKKLTNKAVVSSITNDPDSSNNQDEEDTWVHEYEDPSPSPSPNCHKADYNNDGKVDPADLAVFLSYWGTSNSSGDFNNDNVVNAADLAIFLSYWGPCP